MESLEYHQTILIKHWNKLEKLCETLCNKYGKLYLADDMFCEAIIDKSERAFASFDPKRNDNVEEYMLTCFRYYCRDWLIKYFRRMRNDEINGDACKQGIPIEVAASLKDSSALSARDEVIAILGCLPSLERRLLTLRIGYSWTFPEIAKALNQPESSVRVACNEALLKAQWYANQRIKRNIV